MIPLDFITEWRRAAPWIHDSQVEQEVRRNDQGIQSRVHDHQPDYRWPD